MNSSYKFCVCLWVFEWSYAKEQWRNPETIIPAVLYLFLCRSLWSGGLSWDWTLLCQTLVDSTSLSTILQEESSASLQFYCQDIVEVGKERCHWPSQCVNLLLRKLSLVAKLKLQVKLFRFQLPNTDPDSTSDWGNALAPLLSRGEAFLSPPAWGVLPGCRGKAQEDLRLGPETEQLGQKDRHLHPVSSASAQAGLLPSTGCSRGVLTTPEEVLLSVSFSCGVYVAIVGRI